ncbi:hypothetical protein BKA69DRAFT_683599 [Paraphysoderma sedebokerense]|nr:hypothetical protein BKA69DRAFT_683599 [Paraphysoderma sedebokerense]
MHSHFDIISSIMNFETKVTNGGIWLHQLMEPPSIPTIQPRIAPGAKPMYFPIPNPKSKIVLTRHNIVMAGVREIAIYEWRKSKQTCIDDNGQVKVEYVYELPYVELWNATRTLDSTTVESADGDSENGCTVLKPYFTSGHHSPSFRISIDTSTGVSSELGPPSHQQGIGIFESDVVNDSGNNWIGMNICGLDADDKWVVVGCGDGGVRGWKFGVD